MTTEEILKALAHKDRVFPREALEQAIAQKDEITPHLLKILERVVDDPEEVLDEEDSSYLYALHLLAQFRETRAYPLVVRIASFPPDLVDRLLGDTITETLPKILASVSGGDTSLIKQLAENTEAEEFVRCSAFRALLALVVSGDISREEAMGYYSTVFDAKLKEEPSEEVTIVLTDLADCATDLYPEELYDKINEAFERELIDEFMLDPDFVNEKMAEGKEAALAELREDRHLQLMEDAVKEMESWAWYNESDESDDDYVDLSVEEIMEVLAEDDWAFLHSALRQAVAKKDEITPHLLKSLERAANNPEEVLDEGDDSFIYALYLLAQFREKLAYPLIIKLVSHPPELADDLLGIITTEDLHNILASVSLGDTIPIAELAANTDVEEYVRAAAIRSWLTLVVSGEKSREETVNYYRSLFEGGLEDKNEVVWTELVDCSADLYPEELYEQIKKAFDDGLIDEFFIDLDWVDSQMALGKELVLAQLPEDHHLIEDAASEVEWWASPWDEDEDWGDWDDDDDDDLLDTYNLRISALNGHPLASSAPHEAQEKVGRDDPCPCGSGKKYKECCGA
jgi:hypothetical protein